MARPDLLEDCDVTRQRRSGPGGQHRNKVETAIRLLHRKSGVTAEASERRSQAENLSMAIRRLRIHLGLSVRLPVSGEPSILWRSRCRNGKIAINLDHEDFPTLLAEALDELASADWDLQICADRLGCSPSQLIKFLKKKSEALQLLNQQRAEQGLSRLR
jgi:hypothetical protein